jgi:hypothetical protein
MVIMFSPPKSVGYDFSELLVGSFCKFSRGKHERLRQEKLYCTPQLFDANNRESRKEE